MEAAEPIVGRRRVRQFRTTQEKRFIQLESTVAQSTGDLGARAVRLLSVSVDEGAERQAPGATAASTADHTAGSDALPGSIELTLARGQVRIAGTVDAGTLRTVLRCLLA